jgi:hypothetical protein
MPDREYQYFNSGFMAPKPYVNIISQPLCPLDVTISDVNYPIEYRLRIEDTFKSQMEKYINADKRFSIQDACQYWHLTINFTEISDLYGHRDEDAGRQLYFAYKMNADIQLSKEAENQSFTVSETSELTFDFWDNLETQDKLFITNGARHRLRFMQKLLNELSERIQ